MPCHKLREISHHGMTIGLILSVLSCHALLPSKPLLAAPRTPQVSASRDDNHAAVEKILQDAEELRTQATPDSLRMALEKYNQALSLLRTMGDRSWEAAALRNIGETYYKLEEMPKALEYYAQSLTLSRAVGNRSGEAAALNSMGVAYFDLGEMAKALDAYTQALTISRAAGDHSEEAALLYGIGSAYVNLGEMAKALDYFNQDLPVSRATRDRLREAMSLNGIASVYGNLGERQKALDYFDQALPVFRAIGNRSLEAGTLTNIGLVYRELGENQKALDTYSQSLTIMRLIGNHDWEGSILNSMAKIHDDMGEEQTAIDYYNQAVTVRRAIGEVASEAASLSNLASVYDNLGEKQKALDYYNQALAISREVKERSVEGAVLTGLGLIYDGLGEMQKALDSHNEALRLLRAAGDRLGEAAALNNIGNVYDALGEKRKALDYYNQALTVTRAIGERLGEATTLDNIGKVYEGLGETQKALDYYNQSLTIHRAMGERSGEGRALGGLGSVYEDRGDGQKALDYYNQALLIIRAVGDRPGEASVLNGMGTVYEALGKKQKALDDYNQALAIHRAVRDRSEEAVTLAGSARLQRDLGNLVQARSLIEEALTIVDSQRAQIKSQELRASYFATVQDYFSLYIDILMRLHRQRPSAGFDGLAIGASERARARGLLELLSAAGTDIRRGIEPELLKRERNVQQRLKDKQAAQIKMLSGQYSGEQVAALQKEIEDLLNQSQDVEAEIRVKSPRYAALTQPQPLGLKEIQQLLDPDTVLLEYSLGDERSYLWAVTPTTLSSYELPKRAEIESVARRFRAAVSGQFPGGESAGTQAGAALSSSTGSAADANPDSSHQLSHMLLGPVTAQIGAKRLVIVADGALQYVPFAALPAPRGLSEVSQESLPLLITEHEIVTLPSSSTLAVLRRQFAGREPAPRTLAVLADPVFDADDQRVKPDGSDIKQQSNPSDRSSDRPHPGGGTSPGREASLTELALTRSVQETEFGTRGLGLERLTATRDEAQAIVNLTPAASRLEALDFTANKTTATNSELSQYRIIHFATHGLLNSEHPELSGLVLSLVDEKGQAQDGFLRLNDIFNLNLPADLVVLSACQTGLGKEIKGEGLVGLTRGFMYAGAPRVVVSLWSVNDQATAELMKRFYQGMLKEGQRPAAALRAAQMEMWKEPQWHAPYFWAAFVLQGEWK